jgi:hypothetical protein
VHPEVWEVLHELATPHDGLNWCGDLRQHVRPKGWEYKVNNLREARPDEDEAHEKAGEGNAPEEPKRRQGVEHGPDEGEDHEERVLDPADVEEAAHGWLEAGATSQRNAPT